MKITKEEYYKLFTPDITKLRYDEIINKIDKRFAEIVLVIAKIDRLRGWFDYGNCDYDSEESGGWFDPEKYKFNIDVGGRGVKMPKPFDNCSFPTRWLWEDFEDEFKQAVYDAKMQDKQKKSEAAAAREDLKNRKAKMKEIITAKLTKEELKYITFK